MKAVQRAVAAEFLGTGASLTVVVGSGIMAERLSTSNSGVALLANALATGLELFVLITIFAPVSGAHFNPVVTAASLLRREMPAQTALAYWASQFTGAIAGVWLAHGAHAVYSLRMSRSRRATAFRQDNFMRILTVEPDHDSTYGKK